MKKLMLIIALCLTGSIAIASTCETLTAEVQITAERATDSLTYCGTKWTVQNVLPSSSQCAIEPSEILNKSFYVNDGELTNGHDCEVNTPSELVSGTVRYNSAGYSLELANAPGQIE